ncbi:MAG: enoyl-CoA hydratase/isomerase family protein, partial [Deltaproteobacteria bacterium]|nr:enoyl-CoA hydratase/isomerase family protein [Deltaproteobacteria bacterium]
MTLELPETFTYEKKGHIALMTINRPEAMNAFTGEMLK